MRDLLLLQLLLLCLALLPPSVLSNSCSDFTEAACELTENNILAHDSSTASPRSCQLKCLAEAGCQWFTHFGSSCYMLDHCGLQASCDGCTSGPTTPDISTCPWPPHPETTSPATTTTRHPTTPGPQGCEHFQMGSCELTESNILAHDRFTPSPAACQVRCREESGCHWFTHYDTSCYMLDHCGDLTNCESCVSGPTIPDISDCPWPPQPTTTPPPAPSSTTHTSSRKPLVTTTTLPHTTSRKPLLPTTSTTHQTSRKPLVPTTTHTTSRKPLITTTKTTTRKPTTESGCEDIKINEECDWNYGLLHWYEHVMTGAECQAVCRNVNGANFFSHYNEGHNGEHGFCGCFQTCAWPTSDGCASRCGTHEVFFPEDIFAEESEEVLDSGETFGVEEGVELGVSGQPRPGPHYCHCMHGPLHPDIDTCGIWPDLF